MEIHLPMLVTMTPVSNWHLREKNYAREVIAEMVWLFLRLHFKPVRTISGLCLLFTGKIYIIPIFLIVLTPLQFFFKKTWNDKQLGTYLVDFEGIRQGWLKDTS